ncbi:hypothetical protein [Nocardia sp. CA-290969]|uniref:hypothetical protein n=1 Tax=Nocardia sp. CA-290969 TaxID=3239986 RepID=UPI003D8F0B34
MPAQREPDEIAVIGTELEEPIKLIRNALNVFTEAVEHVTNIEASLTDSELGPDEVVEAWNTFRSTLAEELDIGMNALQFIAAQIPMALVKYEEADQEAGAQVDATQDK